MKLTPRSTLFSCLAAPFAVAVVAGCAASPSERDAAARDASIAAFVVVDDESEKSLGSFPFDRGAYGRAISKARELGAKGVALKFFFDLPSNSVADESLAGSMRGIPVLLQVGAASRMPAVRVPVSCKLSRPEWNTSAIKEPLSMTGVEYPLEAFAREGSAMGFVEARLDDLAHKVEIVGQVDGVPIASLQLEVVELAMGRRAKLRGTQLEIGGRSIMLDEKGRASCDSFEGHAPKKIGIDELLNGRVPKKEIQGKVVVIGYARANSPVVAVEGRQVQVHEVFYRQVECLGRLFGH